MAPVGGWAPRGARPPGYAPFSHWKAMTFLAVLCRDVCGCGGRARFYPRFGRTMEWDTAASQAVLEAAGGCVLDRTASGCATASNDLKTAASSLWRKTPAW